MWYICDIIVLFQDFQYYVTDDVRPGIQLLYRYSKIGILLNRLFSTKNSVMSQTGILVQAGSRGFLHILGMLIPFYTLPGCTMSP